MVLGDVAVVSIPNKGRGYVALKDLNPGDLICESDAVSLIISDAHVGHCCENCLKITQCTACEDCQTAFYCSEECRLSQFEKHELECLPMCRLIPNKCPPIVRQALQCLIYTATTDDKQFLDMHGELDGKSEGVRLKLLEYGRKLRWMLDEDYFPEMSVEDLAGHVSKISKNALVAETQHQGLTHQVGGGMFFEFYILNHECLPNSEAYSIGRRVRVVATRPIQAGMEVTTRYTEGGSYSNRCASIKRHQFQCQCVICLPFVLSSLPAAATEEPHPSALSALSVSTALQEKKKNSHQIQKDLSNNSTIAPSASESHDSASASNNFRNIMSPIFAGLWYEGLLGGFWCPSCMKNLENLPSAVSRAVSCLQTPFSQDPDKVVCWLNDFHAYVSPFYLPTENHTSFSHAPPIISRFRCLCSSCGFTLTADNLEMSAGTCFEKTSDFLEFALSMDSLVDSAESLENASKSKLQSVAQILISSTRSLTSVFVTEESKEENLKSVIVGSPFVVSDEVLPPVCVYLSCVFEVLLAQKNELSLSAELTEELKRAYKHLLQLWLRCDQTTYPGEVSRLRAITALVDHFCPETNVEEKEEGKGKLRDWLRQTVNRLNASDLPQFKFLFP